MLYRFILLSFCFFAFYGCSTNEELILEGDRETVFVDGKKSEISENSNIILSDKIMPNSFEQNAYSSNHLLPHIDFLEFENGNYDRLLSNSPTKTAPIIIGDMIYIQTISGKIIAYNFAIKELVWEYLKVSEKRLQQNFGGLAYSDNKLFATFGTGDVIAFDSKSGKVLWNNYAKSAVYGAPTISEKKLFVQTKNNLIVIYSTHDGKFLDSIQEIENQRPLIKGNSIAISKNIAVAGLSTGDFIGFSTNGEVIWKQKLSAISSRRRAGLIKDIVALPVIDGDSIFITGLSGATGSYDLKTGKKNWKVLFGSSLTPLVSKTTVFILTEKGEIVALNRNDGTLAWKKELNTNDEQFYFPIFLNNQLVVFGNNDNILRISPQSGEVLEKIDFGFSLSTMPVFVKDSCFFTTTNGNLYRMKKDK